MKNSLVIAMIVACSIPATALAAKNVIPAPKHGHVPVLINKGKFVPAGDLSVCPRYSWQGGLCDRPLGSHG